MPDPESCQGVVDELREAGVTDHHLHVVASLARDLKGLPEATIWQKTELGHGIEWGIGLGGVAGLLGGVLAVAFPPAGLVLGGGALLAGTAAGAGVGAAVTALIGSHEHNHELDDFQSEIEQGKVLLMVDVPRKQVDEIKDMILKHHPEAEIGVLKRKS
jgi:hypothetical protein